MKLEITQTITPLKIKPITISLRETKDVYFNDIRIGSFRPNSSFINIKDVVNYYLQEVKLVHWTSEIYSDSGLTRGIQYFSSFEEIKKFIADVKAWIIKTDLEEQEWNLRQENVLESVEI
jgi:hypothetical protein